MPAGLKKKNNHRDPHFNEFKAVTKDPNADLSDEAQYMTGAIMNMMGGLDLFVF